MLGFHFYPQIDALLLACTLLLALINFPFVWLVAATLPGMRSSTSMPWRRRRNRSGARGATRWSPRRYMPCCLPV